MKTKKEKAEYMRKYTQLNKDKINKQRSDRLVRLKKEDKDSYLIHIGRSSLANKKYYKKNKEEILRKAKDKNWYYDPLKGHTKRMKHYSKHPWNNILRARKTSADKKDLPFELTVEWCEKEFEKGCSMTGIKFDKHQSGTPWVAHIDRKIPEKGYTKRNCRLVCASYNLAKKHWRDKDVLLMSRELIRTSDA